MIRKCQLCIVILYVSSLPGPDLAPFNVVAVQSEVADMTLLTTTPVMVVLPPDETPWSQTPDGQAVIATCCIVFTVLVVVIVILAVKLWLLSKK